METITTHRVRDAIEFERDAIAEELMVDPADVDVVDITEEDPAGRVIIRIEGVPAYIAQMSDHHADARLTLTDADPLLGELRFYTTDAITAIVSDIMEWVDGDMENGPRHMTDADADELAALGDELARRKTGVDPAR